MLTSTPPPGRVRTWRAKDADPFATPRTLTSTCRRTAPGSASARGPIGSSTPALFTHRSMRPKRSTTPRANRSRASAWLTSIDAVQASAPCGAVGWWRAQSPRRKPSPANVAAIPAPRPRLAPVMTATNSEGTSGIVMSAVARAQALRPGRGQPTPDRTRRSPLDRGALDGQALSDHDPSASCGEGFRCVEHAAPTRGALASGLPLWAKALQLEVIMTATAPPGSSADVPGLAEEVTPAHEAGVRVDRADGGVRRWWPAVVCLSLYIVLAGLDFGSVQSLG